MSTSPISGHTLLDVTALTKRFSGVAAVQDVDLRLQSGEARGLIGENGAGKSTLIALITGALIPDAGSIRFNGSERSFRRPVDALRVGIGTVHQQNWLIPNLSVAHNLELGSERTRTPLRVLSKSVQPSTIEALRLVGAEHLVQRNVASLTLAERQLVSIARAYGRGGRLMIFDEPTASLSPVETKYLFDVIARLREAGVALLYVTHRLDELVHVVDSITVLRAGRVVAQAPHDAAERTLVDLMAGHDALVREESIARERTRTLVQRTEDSQPLIRARSIRDRSGVLRGVDLDIEAGEIVALVGLPDSGASHLTAILAGARATADGELTVNGKTRRRSSPYVARRSGVSYMAGDRKIKGIAANATVEQTVSSAALGRVSRFGVISRGAERRMVAELMGTCDVRAKRSGMSITALSGGNQQKALFARTLATRPTVIVSEDPTAGVDPAGRDSLYELFIAAVEDGAAVVINSSDLREVATICDRAIVLYRGRIIAELAGHQLHETNLMRAQFGLREPTQPAAAPVP